MNVGIITASDKGAQGEREDLSGAKIAEIMESHGYTIRKKVILPDDQQKLQDEMIAMCDIDNPLCGIRISHRQIVTGWSLPLLMR